MRWSPFADITDYYDSSEKQFMINYRVQNIEGLVDQLRQNGVTIVDEIQSYAYDKFVNIMDPEGNKIELWEPVDRFFTEMGPNYQVSAFRGDSTMNERIAWFGTTHQQHIQLILRGLIHLRVPLRWTRSQV